MRKILKFRPESLWQFQREGVQTTIELKQPLVLVAFLAALVYYLVVQNGIMAMAVSTLGGILLIGYLWARAMAVNVSASRKLRYSAFQVGDELEEQITVENRSTLPVLWAEFTDRSNIPGYTVSSVRSTGPRSTSEWRARTICARRGLFQLGPYELVIGEMFGVFQVRQRYLDRREIIVYPPLAPLPHDLLPHTNTVGSHRPLHQPLAAETISANTTRPFVTGDPLRRVHWRTSARKNDLFVKVFEPEASSNVWLVPDFDASVQAGEGLDSTVEALVIVVASLAGQLLQDRLAVGLFTCTGEPQVVMPQTGRAHLWALMRALAPLQAAPNQPLTSTLAKARNLIDPKDLLIVLTPSMDLTWARNLSATLSRGSAVTGPRRCKAILLDPLSFGGEAGPVLHGGMLAQLATLGIHASLIRKEDIRPVLGAFGALRRWEFKTLGTGRVHVRQAPRQAEAA